MTPRGWRGSATRLGGGVSYSVQVSPETLEVDRRRRVENGNGRLGANKPVTTERCELADRHTVAGDHKRLAFVEAPHDLAALVPQLPLRDLSGHGNNVARRATR